METLRQILFPQSPPAAPQVPTTLAFEGLDPGWAIILFIILGGILSFLFQNRYRDLSVRSKILLLGLRLKLLALILLLWTFPVFISTVTEKLRQQFLVLVDDSGSMGLPDQRTTSEDIIRAKIALGQMAATPELATGSETAQQPPLLHTRLELVQSLLTHPQHKFWESLAERSDLVFYRVGERLDVPISPLPDGRSTRVAFAESLEANASISPLGDALIKALELHRGEPLAGILLISDGASNAGRPFEEAAATLNRAALPVHSLAVGIPQPPDLRVATLRVPRIGFVEEKVIVEAELSSFGLPAQTITARLFSDEQFVEEKEVQLPRDGNVTVQLELISDDPGVRNLRFEVDSLPGEVSVENNAVEDRITILDTRVRVFLVDQIPRWDFRYLLDFLQDDQRLAIVAVLLDTDASLLKLEKTPFIPELPDQPSLIYKSDIVVLGDVDPARLGKERMEWIAEWVNRDGGSLIFLAGRRHQPLKYHGTPLEPLFPIRLIPSLSPEFYGKITEAPKLLVRTRTGRLSPWFKLADQPSKNESIWSQFKGVRWTALVGPAKPGAEVLLVDESVSPPLPVIARHDYGRGKVVFVGTEETHRWRSGFGGKHYNRIWGQIFQSLAEERLSGASRQVQIRSEATRYLLGEEVKISGQLFRSDFTPLNVASVSGTVVYEGSDRNIPLEQSVNLRQLPNRVGEYSLTFTPRAAGNYSFFTALDPEAKVEFTVDNLVPELAEVAVQSAALQLLSEQTGGRAFRFENIQELPDLIEDRSLELTRQRRFELAQSPLFLILLLLLPGLEWIGRRLVDLK